MTEHEAKLLVPPAATVPEPADLFAGLNSWSSESLTLRATYFDTDDLRLTRDGVSVRWRDDGGWTVKTPVMRKGSVLDRTEHEFAGAAGPPPPGVQELVLGWTRGEPLREVAEVLTHRRRHRLLDAAQPVLEVDDDHVATSSPIATPQEFHEIEVELLHPSGKDAFQVVLDRLRTAELGADEPLPKIVRALGPAASASADVPAIADVSKQATVATLFRWRTVQSVRRLIEHDHLVRLGNPTGVHQARVATRRLRADLGLFQDLLPRSTVDAVRGELQWLGRLLGGVRDDDVMIQALQDETRRLGLEAMPSAIAARLQQEREERRSLLLDAMTSPRYAQLLNDLVSLTTDPPLEDREADRRASRRARSLVDKPWQKVRTTIKHLPSAPQDDDLHKVRRRVKQLRYAFEATAPVMNKRARRVERRADQLQELLGVQHDAVVTAEWLHRIALTTPAGDAFVAGQLASSLLDAANVGRNEWRHDWQRLRLAYERM